MNYIILALLVLLALTSTQSPARSRKQPSAILNIDPALVKPPQDQEVCFSPDEPCDVKLTKFIQSAQKSIDVAIYDINLDNFAHNLAALSKKVAVRVLVDRRQSKGSHSIVSTLLKWGVQAKYGHQRGIMHNKFTIVDGKFLETGSFNYTAHAAQANNENQVYLSNPIIVDRFKKRFEELWTRGDKIP